jgi:hypothetical protein
MSYGAEMIDTLDIAAQPHCPDRGTVLRDDPRRLECFACGTPFSGDGTHGS